MTRLKEVETRIASMAGLLEVVGAMRSLAGMRLQEAQRALPAARRYAQTISAAIGEVVATQREPLSRSRGKLERRAIVLCAAEHGFVGAFSEHLISTAKSAASSEDVLFVLGSRAAALAGERGMRLAWIAPMAARPANIPKTVRELTDELYRRIARGEFSRVDLIYAAHSAGSADIRSRTLLPLDPACVASSARAQSPLCNLSASALLEQLTAEYVFAFLAAAALESLASENSARFAAMSAARENVTKKLNVLRSTAREIRQSEITMELLDVVTGAQALEG